MLSADDFEAISVGTFCLSIATLGATIPRSASMSCVALLTIVKFNGSNEGIAEIGGVKNLFLILSWACSNLAAHLLFGAGRMPSGYISASESTTIGST
jgi:hypothetical protein